MTSNQSLKAHSHVYYLPQITCIVFLSSRATWATRSYSAWQRTFRCKRGETEGGYKHWDEWGKEWWLGVIVNNCIQATANGNRVKIRNGVKSVKRLNGGHWRERFKVRIFKPQLSEREEEAGERQTGEAGADTDGSRERKTYTKLESLNQIPNSERL